MNRQASEPPIDNSLHELYEIFRLLAERGRTIRQALLQAPASENGILEEEGGYPCDQTQVIS
jgi:hypothetical protein